MQVQQAYYQKLRRKEPFIDLFPQLRQTFFSYAVCCADDRVVQSTIVRGLSIFSQCRIAIFPVTPEPYCFAVAEFISPYIFDCFLLKCSRVWFTSWHDSTPKVISVHQTV